jgi:hypothetical protein
MTAEQESSETQAVGVSGAETSVLPDGSRSLCIATPGGPLLARMFEEPHEHAAIFLGPVEATPTFNALCGQLAARGVTGLALPWRSGSGNDTEQAAGDLRAAREFLRQRGMRQFVLAGAGEAAPAIIRGAGILSAEAVAVFSPVGAVPRADLERLRGRPLLIFCGDERGSAREIAAHARQPVELFEFPGAGRSLFEVVGDVSSQCLSRMLEALALPGAAKAR